ncbi:MAG: prolipoprotein diacylglyceryl transferase [Candidatus Gracilibacteria bacterium]|nr:prolipoprotein diacylglyceryl transferase [Candidatus Gracilibacteria bacterium]
MLKKLSIRINFDFLIFKKNILWYFLSVFFFSRLFYVISRWNDLKYIENPIEFFIMNDYNFSLMGALFGFFLVFFILLKVRNEKLDNFINGIILSFLFVLPIGFIGSLLGGQVYGKETMYGIEIMYNHPFTPVPYKVPIFPLPIIYSIIFFIEFSALYILSMYVKFKNILGYLGLAIFACIIFILEFFSGKYGVFKETFYINLSQICAIFILIFSIINLKRIYKEDNKSNIIIN